MCACTICPSERFNFSNMLLWSREGPQLTRSLCRQSVPHMSSRGITLTGCEEVESKRANVFRCLILMLSGPVKLLFLLFLIASWICDLVSCIYVVLSLLMLYEGSYFNRMGCWCVWCLLEWFIVWCVLTKACMYYALCLLECGVCLLVELCWWEYC